MLTGLSNLSLACLFYILVQAEHNKESVRIEMADLRRALGYSDVHGTYYRHIRSAMAELNGTFIQFKDSDAPVAASAADKKGRNLVFPVTLNPIFFDFQKNEKGQVSDFTSLPKASELKQLRAKYHMRLMLLALRWQSGGIVPTMSMVELKQWFNMPQKWKPSEALDALVCAQRIVLSLGLSVFFTLSKNKKSIQITVKKTKNAQIANEKPTEYRKRQRLERHSEKGHSVIEKIRISDQELANFARAAADKYRGQGFRLHWLNNLEVTIELSTGLLITKSRKYLSEANNRRFYIALMQKEGAA